MKRILKIFVAAAAIATLCFVLASCSPSLRVAKGKYDDVTGVYDDYKIVNDEGQYYLKKGNKTISDGYYSMTALSYDCSYFLVELNAYSGYGVLKANGSLVSPKDGDRFSYPAALTNISTAYSDAADGIAGFTAKDKDGNSYIINLDGAISVAYESLTWYQNMYIASRKADGETVYSLVNASGTPVVSADAAIAHLYSMGSSVFRVPLPEGADGAYKVFDKNGSMILICDTVTTDNNGKFTGSRTVDGTSEKFMINEKYAVVSYFDIKETLYSGDDIYYVTESEDSDGNTKYALVKVDGTTVKGGFDDYENINSYFVALGTEDADSGVTTYTVYSATGSTVLENLSSSFSVKSFDYSYSDSSDYFLVVQDGSSLKVKDAGKAVVEKTLQAGDSVTVYGKIVFIDGSTENSVWIPSGNVSIVMGSNTVSYLKTATGGSQSDIVSVPLSGDANPRRYVTHIDNLNKWDGVSYADNAFGVISSSVAMENITAYAESSNSAVYTGTEKQKKYDFDLEDESSFEKYEGKYFYLYSVTIEYIEASITKYQYYIWMTDGEGFVKGTETEGVAASGYRLNYVPVSGKNGNGAVYALKKDGDSYKLDKALGGVSSSITVIKDSYGKTYFRDTVGGYHAIYNTSGKMLLEPIYEVKNIANNNVLVYKGGRYGIVKLTKKSSKLVKDFEYSAGTLFSDGSYVLRDAESTLYTWYKSNHKAEEKNFISYSAVENDTSTEYLFSVFKEDKEIRVAAYKIVLKDGRVRLLEIWINEKDAEYSLLGEFMYS